MQLQQLITYIQQMLNKGYGLNRIRTNLIQNGYNRYMIEEAIKYVYAPQPKKKKPNKIILIAGIIIIAAILIIIIILLTSKPEAKASPFSIDTEMASQRIILGSYIMFNVKIEKTGSGMILLKHAMIGPDGREIDSIEERAFKSKYSKLKIPLDAKPGKYKIMTTAELKGITENSKIEFSIAETGKIEVPEIAKESPAEEVKPNESENPKKEEQQQKQATEPAVKDEFSNLTIWERVDAIKDIAKTNPREAKTHCDKIGVASHKNQCYYNIAEVSAEIVFCQLITDEKIIDRCTQKIAELTNNSKTCETISKESRRDNCYMFFVKNGDYSLCDKFGNKYYISSCEARKTMASITVQNPNLPENIVNELEKY